ncbi:MAG: YlxR family protein [Chloroflexi bacterium]|nr:YlxR family protein [Chloroflexota bacterium]
MALSKNRHVPERSCVACGVKMPKVQLVRVVRITQGSVVIDTTGRAPGRGAYLCRIPQCWDRALGKGALGRSLGQDLSSQDLELVRTYYEENIAPQATAP